MQRKQWNDAGQDSAQALNNDAGYELVKELWDTPAWLGTLPRSNLSADRSAQCTLGFALTAHRFGVANAQNHSGTDETQLWLGLITCRDVLAPHLVRAVSAGNDENT